MAYGGDHVEMPPVENWVTDWDWLDDQWGENAIEIWNSVREVCPVATTERYGRAHMPVTMEAIQAIDTPLPSESMRLRGTTSRKGRRAPAIWTSVKAAANAAPTRAALTAAAAAGASSASLTPPRISGGRPGSEPGTDRTTHPPMPGHARSVRS